VALPGWRWPILPPALAPSAGVPAYDRPVPFDEGAETDRALKTAPGRPSEPPLVAPLEPLSDKEPYAQRGLAPVAVVPSPRPWSAWALLAWAMGALVVAALLLAGTLRLGWMRRRLPLLTEGAWVETLAHVTRELGLRRHLRLLQGASVRLPMIWGL